MVFGIVGLLRWWVLWWISVRFPVHFQIEIEGCGIHLGRFVGVQYFILGVLWASFFGLRSIIFGLRGIILKGFWHHFSVLGRSLGSVGGSLGSQGRPKSDFKDFVLNFP